MLGRQPAMLLRAAMRNGASRLTGTRTMASTPSIAQIFESMEYGPAPEDDTALYKWLDAHNREFGSFINGEWRLPEDDSADSLVERGTSIGTAVFPATGETATTIRNGNNAMTDEAIAAAKAAQKDWAALSPHARARHLYSIARHLQKHSRLMAVVEAMDNGKSVRETRDADVPLTVRHFYHHAGWAQILDKVAPDWDPVGVVGQIIPWNFPLLMLAWKIAPALACGNTVVLKPASSTRLSAFLFCDILKEAGLPPGVVNIVSGPSSIGTHLVNSPDVAKVAFTGSTGVGRLLRRETAGSGKKLTLELGGKSPIIVYDSADLDSAVEGCVQAIWFNQGQVCCAGSRLLVQESVADVFVAKLKARMETLRVGHSLDKCIDVGAMVDKSQVADVEKYIEIGRAEGAEIYQAQIPDLTEGAYFPPTLVTNVQSSSTLVQEEIFGPVMTVQTFRTPTEAIKLGNNSAFGLAASVWTENIGLAMETAVSLKAGAMWVNCHNVFDAAAGFGGYKESGYGREGGTEGLYSYLKPSWQATAPGLSGSSKVTEAMRDGAGKWGAAEPGHALPAAGGSSSASALGGLPDVDRTPKMYVGGKQKRPDGNYVYPVFSPGGELLGQVGDGNRKDVRDAVEAARAAAGGWGKRAAHDRAQICYYIAENLSIRKAEFAQRLVSMTGRSSESCEAEVEESISRLFTYAAWSDKMGGEVKETPLYGLVASLNEPVGAIGIACPTEYPLLGLISLVAPAVVRGNTVVVVPSPEHPLTATDLYQVLDTSDLPGGVINIVTGTRDHITKTLVEHQHIDAMWYFGGGVEGSYNVERLSAGNLKRVFTDYGVARDWMNPERAEGQEFLLEATEIKNVWVPIGEQM